MGKPDWHTIVLSHTFFTSGQNRVHTNPGTQWVQYSFPYAHLDLRDALQLSTGTVRLRVYAEMSGQDTAYICLGGSSQTPGSDADKICVTELTAGTNGYFASAEETYPGGITDRFLIVYVKSSTATGDIPIRSIVAVFY